MSVVTIKGIRVSLSLPNDNQIIPFRIVEPCKDNIRRFIVQDEREFASLVQRYTDYREARTNLLPDAPVLRYISKGKQLEIRSGHRRVLAAQAAGLDALPQRVVTMTEEEAFHFVTDANSYVPITTIERALRAWEMYLMDFSQEEIGDRLGVGTRYLAVGAAVDPTDFTDQPKLCDPSITAWYEALQWGEDHFRTCFKFWNAGVWNAAQCEREFRMTGRALPQDNKQKGLRLSVSQDGRKLHVIGCIDLDMYEDHELEEVSRRFIEDFEVTAARGLEDRNGGFGERIVRNYNPETI